MDCTGLLDKRADCPGLNALVMARVANHDGFREWMQVAKAMLRRELRAKRLQSPDDAPLLDIVNVCRSGKHKSVACAQLLAFVLGHRAWHVTVDHMHHEFWGSCKGDCRKCLSCEHAKADALEYALTTWRQV